MTESIRMRFDTNTILEITGGDVDIAPFDARRPLTSLTWDSRTASQDCLYAALPGERVDGNDFIAAAVEAGAMLALAGRVPDDDARAAARSRGAGIVVVRDVAAAITALAEAWRRELGATVVGITGSVGKTTVKSMVRDVLATRFATCATKGNFNNELGAPYTVLSADAGCEMLVVEMGMDDLGQIAHICSFARPDMGVVTNVGVSHLERLGTRENIARAKAELFEALPAGGVAFVNADDDMTPFLRAHARLDARGVRTAAFRGTGRPDGYERAVWAEDVTVDDEGRPSFTLCIRGFACPDARLGCTLSLRGVHNVSNACAAAAVGLSCGVEPARIVAALSATVAEAGRQEAKRAACGALVFDDSYNASPASMQASLAMLASYKTQGRRIAVLGDMGELGAASVEGHRATGAAAARAHVDVLVCVGDAAADIARGAREAGMPAKNIMRAAQAEDAARIVGETVEGTDVVLVKASHFMRLDRVVEGMIA